MYQPANVFFSSISLSLNGVYFDYTQYIQTSDLVISFYFNINNV